MCGARTVQSCCHCFNGAFGGERGCRCLGSAAKSAGARGATATLHSDKIAATACRSIRRNIIYGLEKEDGCDAEPSQEEIEAAARLANAHDFISALPQVSADAAATSIAPRD